MCLNNSFEYIEHNDPVIYIPRHISKIGVYTSHIILLNSIITFIYKYRLLALLEFILYITSVQLWREIKHECIERKIDVCAVVSTLSYATYTSYHMKPIYTYIWISSLILATIVYIKNDYMFYCQIKYTKGLEYTLPNTYQRECAYYRNVITHCITLHLGLSFISIYCIVHNPL